MRRLGTPACVHLTPCRRRSAYRFQRSYIRSHLADVAQNVKKPFILEEYVLTAARDFLQAHPTRCVRRPSAGLARSRRTRRRVFATSTTSQHTAWRRRMRRLTGRCRAPSSGELSNSLIHAIDEPSTPCRHWYDAGIGPGQYGVHTTDTTWPIITKHVGVMEALFASAPAICPA